MSNQSLFVYLGMVRSKQAGLTMMEYGISRKSMSSHILLKNFLQFSVGIICFWLLGYSFSTQNVKSKFIGENYFGGDD
jgi:Ammonia permease